LLISGAARAQSIGANPWEKSQSALFMTPWPKVGFGSNLANLLALSR